MNKMNHGLLHLLGCLLPISAIFLLPLFGVSSGAAFTVFIVLMLACHIFMIGGHGGHQPDATQEQPHSFKKEG